ncbi:hypothetical protein WMY93_031991 [Mugilogobius chulae]|uniref:SPIN-DOC-like zinc-finger domain-containing protein n=1 Tax=Mugilogobius chulae TaxID=88201 RepID=A0AAW0MKN5_9GOBI
MERNRQWHTDKRHFKNTWEDEYFFTEINSKAVCLICNQSVAVLKEYNLRRHFETKHAAFSRFKGEERKKKSGDLLAKLRSQQGSLARPSFIQDSATRASYEISALIAKTGRSFSTGDFVKDCLSIAVSLMCPSQARTFAQLSLSRNTVTRRIEDMSRDIKEQFKAKSSRFAAFSLACDESTDISDSAQLLIFIRGVSDSMEITQELAGLETLRGTTKSEDLFAAVGRVLEKCNLSWEKMSGITTDGAPAMTGKKAGLATLVAQKVAQCGGKALSHRQFRALLEEIDAQYSDVLYHQEVRWLSRGKVLKRFFELRRVIAEFLTSKGGDTQVPSDEKWICDVAFMVDITDMLNALNVQLQGKEHIITEMFDHVKAFQMKLDLLCRQLSAGNVAHFPSLREVTLVREKLPEYAGLLRNLNREFDQRFVDFKDSAGDMELFSQPFNISPDSVSDQIQMELIEFQCDSELKNKFMALNLKDFYTQVSLQRYPHIKKHAQVMLSLFGSTYICEQTFSVMNLNKSKLRGTLTDSHLEDILTLSVSQLQPNIEKLVKGKDQLHVSH